MNQLIRCLIAFITVTQIVVAQGESVAQFHRELIDYQESAIKAGVAMIGDTRRMHDGDAVNAIQDAAQGMGGQGSLSIYKLSSLATENPGTKHIAISILIQHIDLKRAQGELLIENLNLFRSVAKDAGDAAELVESRRTLRSHLDKLQQFKERAVKFSKLDPRDEERNLYALHVFMVMLANPSEKPMSFNEWKMAMKSTKSK